AHECLRLLLDACFVAGSPPATVNPEGNRHVFGLGRGVNVKHLPLSLRSGIGQPPVYVRLVAGERRSEGKNEESSEKAHGLSPNRWTCSRRSLTSDAPAWPEGPA